MRIQRTQRRMEMAGSGLSARARAAVPGRVAGGASATARRVAPAAAVASTAASAPAA